VDAACVVQTFPQHGRALLGEHRARSNLGIRWLRVYKCQPFALLFRNIELNVFDSYLFRDRCARRQKISAEMRLNGSATSPRVCGLIDPVSRGLELIRVLRSHRSAYPGSSDVAVFTNLMLRTALIWCSTNTSPRPRDCRTSLDVGAMRPTAARAAASAS
jgi:hypothetical protein